MNQAEFLDQIRGIAQLGLTYATDPYDKERYERLFHLAADGYEATSGLPASEVPDRFRQEVGYVTAKVGVDAAIYSEDGTALLLIRRPDSGAWALPGGWAELGRTAEESVAQEVLEETTLAVQVGALIAVSSQLPGGENGPHTSIHVLYECTATGGTPSPTAEAAEIAYHRPDEIANWHADHGEWAAKAMAWRRSHAPTA